MRRLILEDPFSRSAIWSRNLAVFALIVAIIGILLARKGLDPLAALAIIGGALVFAGFAILFAFVAMAVIWRTGFRGLSLALGGLVLSLLLFAYPAYIAVQARSVPAVADISTDADDPPNFMLTGQALKARRGTTPPRLQTVEDREDQERLYPDLQSLSFDAEPFDVDQAIHKLIKKRKWQIVDEVQPKDSGYGHIDVIVTTAVMGFSADVTFRIKSIGNHTQVDIRSVSRHGWQERPGSNAARVQDLASDLEDAISASS